MILHSDIMIYELLELYFNITNESTINISNLKDAFNTLQSIINNYENTQINLNFEKSLENFCSKYQDYLDIFNNTLIINEDLDDLLDAIIDINIEYSELDATILEYKENIAIYKALDLEIPHEEMQNFFKINKEMIEVYQNIAELETEGITNNLAIYYLRKLKILLYQEFKSITPNTLIKLKMCCADLNNCLDPEKEGIENSNWYLALFGKYQELKKLNYAKIEYLCSEIEYFFEIISDYDEPPITIQEYFTKNINDLEDNNELNIFLTNLFINIHNFINNTPLSTSIKKTLTIKKYQLLSTPPLKKIENTYLSTGTIPQTTPNIPKETLTKSSFNVLFNIVIKSVLSLDYSNDEINENPELYSLIILHSHLIKTYLELSLNEDYKKQITDLITTSRFYNNKEEFSISISIINDIIFNPTQIHQR